MLSTHRPRGDTWRGSPLTVHRGGFVQVMHDEPGGPGGRQSATQSYPLDLSRILAWLARERRDVAEQLE
jgi:hypothetical protein